MSTKTKIVACRASYCKVFFDHFPVSGFFNSHAWLQQLLPSSPCIHGL